MFFRNIFHHYDKNILVLEFISLTLAKQTNNILRLIKIRIHLHRTKKNAFAKIYNRRNVFSGIQRETRTVTVHSTRLSSDIAFTNCMSFRPIPQMTVLWKYMIPKYVLNKCNIFTRNINLQQRVLQYKAMASLISKGALCDIVSLDHAINKIWWISSDA